MFFFFKLEHSSYFGSCFNVLIGLLFADRISQIDPLSPYSDQETGRRERKGWRVKIHDLSGSAVAAAFITTPFVPSAGGDWVARLNPGAWLIARPNSCTPGSKGALGKA